MNNIDELLTAESKRRLRNKCFNFLGCFGENIKEKMTNICGKTGKYNVPDELYQKRTSRTNRILISWHAVKKNNLTIKQLETCENGVVVELLNGDFFDDDNYKDEVFNELIKRVGSDGTVSTMISFRTENGSSSSEIPRKYFNMFLNNTKVNYRGNSIIVNKDNYQDYAIKKIANGSGSLCGNDKWDGFLFVSIKGGQQDTIETHKNNNMTLFNPACEYANEQVCRDIDLVLAFFAMKAINSNELENDRKTKYEEIMNELKNIMEKVNYDLNGKKYSLYKYCIIHPSVMLVDNQLTDPIQLVKLNIDNFNIPDNSDKSVDLTHNEAVNNELFYWDEDRKCILSPARPTNIFWSYHLSNMMQQNYNLKQFIEYEEDIYNRRQKFKKIFDELDIL